MVKYLTNIDLNKNQLLNAVIQNLASAPAGKEGLVYFDTTKNMFGLFAGGEWKYMASQADVEAELAKKQGNLKTDNTLTLAETAGEDGKFELKVNTGNLAVATADSLGVVKSGDKVAVAADGKMDLVDGTVSFAKMHADAVVSSGEGIADSLAASDEKLVTEKAVRAGLDAVAEAAQTATKIDGETIQRKGEEAGEHAGELYVRQATDALTGVVELATVDEAKAGTDTERALTPAGAKALVGQDIEAFRTAEVVLEGKTIAADKNTISGLAASNFADGKVALGAAEAEGEAETLAEAKLISEKLVDQKIAAATPYATTDVAGIVKLATSEMAIAGTDTEAAVTSKALHDAIAKNIVGAVTYIGALSGISYPVQKGDLFLVDVDTTFAGVDLKKGDYILFSSEVEDEGSLAETSFDVIDNSESDDLVRKDAAQTLTNKTIDASNNTISNLSMTNLAAANAEFATTETTDELKSAAKVASLAKVEELIASAQEAVMAVDDVTIGHTTEGKLEVKDNGLTVAKMNSEAVSTAIAATGAASDTKLATEKAVRDLHDGIPAEAMTLTNKTFDANAEGNALSNVELEDMAAGVVQTTLRASGEAADTAVATEKAVRDALDAQEAAGLHKVVEACGALTPVDGMVTWTIAHTLGADVEVLVKDASGNMIIADVQQTENQVVISFNSDEAVAEGAFKAVLVG